MYIGIKVPVIESKRGWGAKVDDHMVCLSVESAKAFITEFNADNTEKEVPDWYMYAENSTRPIDLTDEQYAIIEATEKKRIWLSSLNK